MTQVDSWEEGDLSFISIRGLQQPLCESCAPPSLAGLLPGTTLGDLSNYGAGNPLLGPGTWLS